MTTTADPQLPRQTFAYTAQTFDGQPMNGSIDAVDLDDASRRLSAMRLRIIRLDPAAASAHPRPLSGEDFAAFNQQLAHLSASGLPIERGLRLIAEDLEGGLGRSIRDVVAELENGVPLGEAFERHRKQFPTLYGAIVDAGVRSGSLPAVLFSVGRHIDLVSRLRTTLWRAAAYPLMVFAGLLIVLLFLCYHILPQFEAIYGEWHIEMPAITRLVFLIAKGAPLFVALACIVIIGIPLGTMLLRLTGLDRAAADLLLPLPIIGPVLRRNVISRWCDAMKLGVQSGMSLPASVELAGDIVGSPAVRRDGRRIVAQATAGQPIDALPGRLSIVPLPVLAIIQTSSQQSDLVDSLDTLGRMYEQQAEMRLSGLQALLTPLLILAVAVLVGLVVLGLFAPLLALFHSLI